MSNPNTCIHENLSRLSMLICIPLLIGVSLLDAQTGRRLVKQENRTGSEDVIVIPQPKQELMVDPEIDIIIDNDLIHWEIAQVIEAEPVEPLEPLEPVEPDELMEYDDEWDYIYEYEINEDEIRKQVRRAEEHARELARHAREQARHAAEQSRLAGEQRARRVIHRDSEEWQQVSQAYKDAYGLILEEVWAEALRAFQQFLEQYEVTSYTDDARFWICYTMERTGNPDEEVFEAYQQFIQEFDESDWTDDAKANLLKIGQRLVETNRRNRDQYSPIVDQLQQEYENEVAIQALYGLRKIGDEQALDAVLRLYHDMEDGAMRKRIIYELRYYDFPVVIEELQDIAVNDPDPEVREEAIYTLGRISSTAVIKPLTSLLKTSDDPAQRRAAVMALRRVESDEVVPILLDVARNDVHVQVRTEAVSALSRIGTPEAQAALIELLGGN